VLQGDAREGVGEVSKKEGIKVTVEDLATGEKEEAVIWDDYILVTAGSCEQSSVQVFGNGTHNITVKGVKS
jgi:hypothetical protein